MRFWGRAYTSRRLESFHGFSADVAGWRRLWEQRGGWRTSSFVLRAIQPPRILLTGGSKNREPRRCEQGNREREWAAIERHAADQCECGRSHILRPDRPRPDRHAPSSSPWSADDPRHMSTASDAVLSRHHALSRVGISGASRGCHREMWVLEDRRARRPDCSSRSARRRAAGAKQEICRQRDVVVTRSSGPCLFGVFCRLGSAANAVRRSFRRGHSAVSRRGLQLAGGGAGGTTAGLDPLSGQSAHCPSDRNGSGFAHGENGVGRERVGLELETRPGQAGMAQRLVQHAMPLDGSREASRNMPARPKSGSPLE